jgi:hypothetical protein
VVFGGGITRRLHDTCQLAQAQYGIITSLPLEAQAVAPSEEEQLRFSLRNARNRAMYEEEIAALVQKNRSLEMLYQQEMGKVHARTYSQHLRDIGLGRVWFAILEGVPIASGTTRQEVEQTIKRIVPQHKLPFIYTFQVGERGSASSGCKAVRKPMRKVGVVRRYQLNLRRSSWIPGSAAPTVPEKCTAFSSPLKNKGFTDEKVTTMGLDDLDTSTPLESNKSL